MKHEPIVVTIVSSLRAAKDLDRDENELLDMAKAEGVLIDANDETHAAVFGISPYYLPEGWLDEVKNRPMVEGESS